MPNMKISFLISAVVFYAVRTVFSNPIQVGTVLFTTTDLVKKCWSESDKSLLRARLIMQDVLPDPECINFSKPNVVMILLEYFHSCYEIISISTYGKLQNLMYLALSDAIGGYLRAYVLPLTRKAYYAGLVKYSEAKKLFQLYEDIKLFLKTNGMGWVEPQKFCSLKLRLKPLLIRGAGGQSACRQLYTIEKRGNLRVISLNSALEEPADSVLQLTKISKETFPEESLYKTSKLSKRKDDKNSKKYFVNLQEHTKKESEQLITKKQGFDEGEKTKRTEGTLPDVEKTQKQNYLDFKKEFRQFQELKKLKNRGNEALKSSKRRIDIKEEKNNKDKRKCTCDCNCQPEDDSDDSKRIIIPLPVLDDACTPHTVAVPFRSRPLRDLQTGKSAFVLVQYYTLVIKCLASKCKTKKDITNFNAMFHSWLVSEVCPHLSDEIWYPGFGGVLRIMETIKKFGAEPSLRDPVSHDIAFMFPKGIGFDEVKKDKTKSKYKIRDVGVSESTQRKRYFIFSILIVSSIFLIAFCTCAFYIQATKSKTYSKPPKRRGEISSKNERLLNFQFLIKFFKKEGQLDEECEKPQKKHECEPETKRDSWKKLNQTTKPRHYKMNDQNDELGTDNPETTKADIREKIEPKGIGQLIVTGKGDVPAFIISNAESAKNFTSVMTPVWHGQTRLEIHDEVIEESFRNQEKCAGDANTVKFVKPVKEFYDGVKTLWKKPSLQPVTSQNESKNDDIIQSLKKKTFEETGSTSLSKSLSLIAKGENKDDYLETKSSSHSESCSHSCITSTNPTSHTQDSMGESDSESEDSNNSESDY